MLLPLGISFVVFEKTSYLVDVYRGRTPREHDPQNVGDPTKGWHTLEPQEHG
jgi:hypothetical protein